MKVTSFLDIETKKKKKWKKEKKIINFEKNGKLASTLIGACVSLPQEKK